MKRVNFCVKFSITPYATPVRGLFVYFEIATLLNCDCSNNASKLTLLSWPKIKEGYAAMERLYGTSKLKMNRFAFLATVIGDKAAAKETFARLGNDWDPTVWRNRAKFDAGKAWAMN